MPTSTTTTTHPTSSSPSSSHAAAPSLSDFSTLTSSAQIFSARAHTLPQIRQLHRSLRGAIDDKAARLRVQVGGSYRELLGTADKIVTMKGDMDAVVDTLGRMGGQCGRGVVGAKVEGLGRFVTVVMTGQGRGRGGEEEDERLLVGREGMVRLLEGCVLAVGRVLSRGGGGGGGGGIEMGRGDRLIVAAKICVLGRLLVKSLSATGGGGKDDNNKNNNNNRVVRRAERQLEGLRHRLLARVKNALANVPVITEVGGDEGDKAAARVKQQQGDVLKALSAYSLPTNSGAQDVLRHFLRVRSEAMVLAAETPDDGARSDPRDLLRCLSLYTRTLQDVQALVPNRLYEGLAALKKDRLLADESLRPIEGLRLDVYERWCGDEIRYFTPFIRHDDLDGKQAREMLTNWAKEGSEVFLRGLERTLDDMVEFKAIVDLRTSVLKLWIAEGGKVRGFDSSVLLDRIRDSVNDHMLQVLEAKVNKLRLVGSEASATLDAWREGMTDQHIGLWEEGSFDMDLSNGAAQFTQDVVARLYGRNDAVSRAVTSYKSWFHVIDDVGQVVDQLKRQRWDNDVDEIEDEETIEHRQKLLAKDDPQKLSGHLSTSLVKAFKNLDDHLVSLWGAHEDGPNSGQIAMYLLRLLRDMRSRLPELEAIRSFGLTAIPSLHRAAASTVVISPLDELATVALARRKVVGRSLWEGTPELPTSPSPGIFGFLRNLTVSMGDGGGDLWSPRAVGILKEHLLEQLCEIWLEAVAAVSPGQGGSSQEVEGTVEDFEKETGGKTEAESSTAIKKDGPTVEQRRDLLVQWFFDILYLGHFLAPPSSSSSKGSSEFKKLEETIYQASGLEEAKARERIAKSSQEYWKRTSLLFGLLA